MDSVSGDKASVGREYPAISQSSPGKERKIDLDGVTQGAEGKVVNVLFALKAELSSGKVVAKEASVLHREGVSIANITKDDYVLVREHVNEQGERVFATLGVHAEALNNIIKESGLEIIRHDEDGREIRETLTDRDITVQSLTEEEYQKIHSAAMQALQRAAESAKRLGEAKAQAKEGKFTSPLTQRTFTRRQPERAPDAKTKVNELFQENFPAKRREEENVIHEDAVQEERRILEHEREKDELAAEKKEMYRKRDLERMEIEGENIAEDVQKAEE